MESVNVNVEFNGEHYLDVVMCGYRVVVRAGDDGYQVSRGRCRMGVRQYTRHGGGLGERWMRWSREVDEEGERGGKGCR